MANARKARGMKTQALVAEDLKKDGLFPYATDAGAGRQGEDILNTDYVSIEVKARSGFEPVSALKQAETNAAEDEIPIVVLRMNGQGPANIDEWAAMVRWGDMKKLIQYLLKCRAKGVKF